MITTRQDEEVYLLFIQILSRNWWKIGLKLPEMLHQATRKAFKELQELSKNETLLFPARCHLFSIWTKIDFRSLEYSENRSFKNSSHLSRSFIFPRVQFGKNEMHKKMEEQTIFFSLKTRKKASSGKAISKSHVWKIKVS